MNFNKYEISPLLFGGESAGMWVWTGPLKNLIDQVWVSAALRGRSLDGPRRCAALCGERPAAGVGGDPLHDAGQTVQTGVPLRLQAACDQNQAEQLSKRKNKDPDLFLLLCLFDSFF